MDRLQPFLKKWVEVLLLVLVIGNILVWTSLYTRRVSPDMRVYFLDVGQGDAIFIDSPTHGRMLIDGGKNRKVISELGKILPFGDRRIDVVIATHPDADHIGGLPEVVKRFNVGLIIEPGVESDNEFDDELDSRAVDKNISQVLAKRGQVIDFGDGAVLTILFPNQDVSNWETNDASIVARLDYGESSFLFTGDASIRTENILMSLNKSFLDIDVLKAGHHGSRTSTSLTFAEVTSPEFVIISAGRDNTYGHPHKEVLNILERVNSKILSTSELGTIKFETDGERIKVK